MFGSSYGDYKTFQIQQNPQIDIQNENAYLAPGAIVSALEQIGGIIQLRAWLGNLETFHVSDFELETPDSCIESISHDLRYVFRSSAGIKRFHLGSIGNHHRLSEQVHLTQVINDDYMYRQLRHLSIDRCYATMSDIKEALQFCHGSDIKLRFLETVKFEDVRIWTPDSTSSTMNTWADVLAELRDTSFPNLREFELSNCFNGDLRVENYVKNLDRRNPVLEWESVNNGSPWSEPYVEGAI